MNKTNNLGKRKEEHRMRHLLHWDLGYSTKAWRIFRLGFCSSFEPLSWSDRENLHRSANCPPDERVKKH